MYVYARVRFTLLGLYLYLIELSLFGFDNCGASATPTVIDVRYLLINCIV
jgi:hypothetical protein